MMNSFKLSAALVGHEDDVKAVVFPAPNTVITASRDQTVRLWQTTATPPKFDDMIASHGEGFINAAAYLAPSSRYPDGLIISGGRDALIDVRQPGRGAADTPEAVLIGHASNVCALAVDKESKCIISGSWDGCAKVWSVGKWSCEATLEGHEGSVWAVLPYDEETIITGAADKLIRIYHRSGKLLNTIKGSQDVVRALCRLPRGHSSGADFASAGNDGCIRLWGMNGRELAVMYGHESFIYSLAVLPTGELVSSGEDRTVRIWNGIECIQTIMHPAISVWSVAVCAESGDIVAGASDRVARVFSRTPERFADTEVLSQFEDSVKSSTIPQEQVGEPINKEKLPGPEFLQQKSGTKEGQVVMIKESNGSVTAHMWSTVSSAWTSVGTVVEAAASSGKKIQYKGQDYDFVFDVDIEDGKPPLKLPFNLSQNPYDAASKFITSNELPVTYLEQVANFIVTNTQGHTLGPQEQGTGGVGLPAGADPWGSEARYRPGEGSSSNNSSVQVPKILPQKSYLSIMVASVDKMHDKLLEINTQLQTEAKADIAFNATELSTLKEVVKALRTNGQLQSDQTDVPPTGVPELLVKIIMRWPYTNRLPALDLVRLTAPVGSVAAYKDSRGNIIDHVISSVNEQDPPLENNTMMAIRAFVNLFASIEGRKVALEDFDKVQTFTVLPLKRGTTNRNLLVATATLFVNYAVLLTTESSGSTFEQESCLMEILSTMISKEIDSEVVYRALVAVGTLLGNHEVRTAAKEVYDIEKNLQTALSKAKDPRIKNIAVEIKALLRTV